MRYFYFIGPVGSDERFPEKKRILEELAREAGLEPFFPLDRHSVFAKNTAADDIRGAEILVADLSFARPSCYYELGLADALGATVRMIAELGTDIHQVADRREVATYHGLDEYRVTVARALATDCKVRKRVE